ncbi:T9SS type A sorting domain-containing protein [Flavobacteriales bacterium]|nr:T9SS type A sorting domain-containing protein [Flavobacteriales bacterium]
MKKVYILFGTLVFSLSALAQVTNICHEYAKGKKSQQTISYSNEKSAPFWTEDFATGIPATWTNSTAPWEYRGPTTSPNQNTGTQGAYGTASTTISSTTQTNGFIIFDSDYYDNNGTQGNFGNGPYPTPHNGELMTDMIDLTAYSDVTLIAHSYFRTFQGQAFVAFYVNGVYDSQVQVHSNLAVNDATTTDAVALIRLPLTVCGNADVQMQFIFDGTTQSNVNGSGYYFWMLDDLELVETPNYLMDVVDQNHGGWDIGYLATSGVGMDYTYKPQIQSDANPYMFEMTMANVGALPLHGIQMNVEVFNSAGASVFTSSSDTTTLAVLDTSSYLAAQTYAPPWQGVYDMNFWGSSDSISTTDISVMTATITDSVYGRDDDNPGSASWRVGRSCGGLQLGNKFDIYVLDEATSVSAYVADYSVVGANMYGILYEVDTTGGQTSYVPLAQTNDYTIQAGDRDNWVTLGFNQATNLFPGMYMVAIGGYAHPLDTFGISVSGQAEVTMSMIYDDGSGCDLGSQSPPYWYWITSTPMIRLNLGTISVNNIDENTFNGNLSIYPNPSKGNFMLELHGVENDTYTLIITDLLGKEIFIKTIDVKEFIKENIDISTYSQGTYLLNIANSTSTITKKLIIE